MGSKNKKKSIKIAPELSEKVERIVEPHSEPFPVDTGDPDVLSYLQDFLNSYSQLGPLEPTNLLTSESAKQALVMLERKHSEIQAQLRTARALKRLLQSQKGE